MAQEMVNRLFASVKAAGDGTILARDGNILSVTRTGAGVYRIVLSEPINIVEMVAGGSIDGDTEGQITLSPISDTIYDMHTLTIVGVAADRPWSMVMHRTVSNPLAP